MNEKQTHQVGAIAVQEGWLIISLPTSLLLEALKSTNIMQSPFSVNGVTFELRKEQK